MKRWSVAMLAVVFVLSAGCDELKKKIEPAKEPEKPVATEDVVPCDAKDVTVDKGQTKIAVVGPGFMHRKGTYYNGVPHQMFQASHCVTCKKATSDAEHFACEGDE